MGLVQAENKVVSLSAEEAVRVLSGLHPDALVIALHRVADIQRQDAQGLRNDWQDPVAGEIWDIAATELERAAVVIKKHWDTL